MKSNSSPSAPAKSLKPVFRENTEIQAFFLLRQNSSNCNFAVVCAVKTGEMHTICTRCAHDERQYNDMKEAISLAGAEFLYAII